MEDNSERRRTITWEDPTTGAQERLKLHGLDYLRAIMAGQFPPPPIAQLMGFTMVEAEAGRVVFECQPAEFHYNPNGAVHGGLAATLLDSAMGCAIQSMLEAGIRYTTIELHVNYLRPLTLESGLVRCEGKTIHVGRQLAVAEGRIMDAHSKLYAHGTTTCMVFTP